MKDVLLICICLLLTSGKAVWGTLTVHILSEDYAISGYYDGASHTGEPISDSYNVAALTPISREVSYPESDREIWYFASSSTGPFYVDVDTGAYNMEGPTWAEASTEATWLFRPEKAVTATEINFFCEMHQDGWYGSYSIEVKDMTTGQQLFIASSTDFEGEPYAWLGKPSIPTGPLDFDSNHLYTLHMYVSANANEDATGAIVWADLSLVPEPATLLLLGLGAVMVRKKLWLRQGGRKVADSVSGCAAVVFS
ncbi:MAG: PEP-CTERM sorting domain-containing protein [Deltaproteobacteria bacterium]|nr:PEP-CTERM sorting domain-containing protein [Deltaproteobacteria bacterium]